MRDRLAASDADPTLDAPEREPRGRQIPRIPRPPVFIHHLREEDEEESSSLPKAKDEYIRSRSLSPTSRYQIEKESFRLRQLWHGERRESAARQRAELLARLELQRERDEERELVERQEREARQRDEFFARLQRQRESHERNRYRYAEQQRQEGRREHARIQQEQEDLERLRATEARQSQRQREEKEHLERSRAADRTRQLREERDRYRYTEHQRRDIQPPIIPIKMSDLESPRRHSFSGEKKIDMRLIFKDWNPFSNPFASKKTRLERTRPQHRPPIPPPPQEPLVPKHENLSNNDLASLLSVQSFADSGYESQIMHIDHSNSKKGPTS